jgi:hypothetical protein
MIVEDFVARRRATIRAAASNGSAGLRLCDCWRGGEAILIDGEARKPGKKRGRARGFSEGDAARPITASHLRTRADEIKQASRSRWRRFRTIQVCPKDLPATLQQVERAVDGRLRCQGGGKPDVREGAPSLGLDHNAIVAFQIQCR